MSTTLKKAPTKHEEWQDDIKSTDDMYREHDAWVREQKEVEERKKKYIVNELSDNKKIMLEEQERNERKESILRERRLKIEEENILKEENIQIEKKKWWIKALNVLMGWE